MNYFSLYDILVHLFSKHFEFKFPWAPDVVKQPPTYVGTQALKTQSNDWQAFFFIFVLNYPRCAHSTLFPTDLTNILNSNVQLDLSPTIVGWQTPS